MNLDPMTSEEQAVAEQTEREEALQKEADFIAAEDAVRRMIAAAHVTTATTAVTYVLSVATAQTIKYDQGDFAVVQGFVAMYGLAPFLRVVSWALDAVADE